MKHLVTALVLGASVMASQVGAVEIYPLGPGGPHYTLNHIAENQNGNLIQDVSKDAHFNHKGGRAIITGELNSSEFQHVSPQDLWVQYEHWVHGSGIVKSSRKYSYGDTPKLQYSHTDTAEHNGELYKVNVYKQKGWHVDNYGNDMFWKDTGHGNKKHVHGNSHVNGRWLDTGLTYYFLDKVTYPFQQ